MNRRTLLQGFAATATGLLLPASVTENVEAVRRYHFLDKTMIPGVRFEGTDNPLSTEPSLPEGYAWVWENKAWEGKTYEVRVFDNTPIPDAEWKRIQHYLTEKYSRVLDLPSVSGRGFFVPLDELGMGE